MKYSLRHEVVTNKVINHPDYLVMDVKLPKKPKNKNLIRKWEKDCYKLKKPIINHNSRLRKKIWRELNGFDDEAIHNDKKDYCSPTLLPAQRFKDLTCYNVLCIVGSGLILYAVLVINENIV